MPAAKMPSEGVYEKNPGSGIWYVRYRLNGKLIRKAIGKQQAAVDYHRKVKVLIRTGEGHVPATAKGAAKTDTQLAKLPGQKVAGVTVSELCDDLLKHIAARPEAFKDQVNPPQRIEAVRRKFGDREAESLRPFEITDWLDSLGRKPATLNRLKSTISGLYRLGRHRDKVRVNPARDVRSRNVGQGVIRFLTLDEERRLRDVLQSQLENKDGLWQYDESDVRHRICELDISLGTGMRKGEQYGLTWKDVDFTDKKILLVDTKNKTDRIVYMIDDVVTAFETLRTIGTVAKGEELSPDDAVFAIADNKKWWSTALKAAGIKNYRWHDNRHSFCSRLAQSGASLKVIAEAAGHRTIQMSARYAHLHETNLRDAMAVLNRNAVK